MEKVVIVSNGSAALDSAHVKSGERVQWERRLGQRTWKKAVNVSNGSAASDSAHGKSGGRVQWERRLGQRTWKKRWSCPMGAPPWTAHTEKMVIVSNRSALLDNNHQKIDDPVRLDFLPHVSGYPK